MSDGSSVLVTQPKADAIIPHGSEWEAIQQIAQIMMEGGLLPEHLDTTQKVITVLLFGRDLGIPATESVRSIHVIKGKPSLSAELMLSLAYRNIRNFEFKVEQSTHQLCKVSARRSRTDEWTSITFSMQDAARAGLAEGGTWRKYPAALLRARATSALMRVVAPDAIRGIHLPEELGAAPRELEVDALAAQRGAVIPPVDVDTTTDDVNLTTTNNAEEKAE